jgi:putative membrane protein
MKNVIRIFLLVSLLSTGLAASAQVNKPTMADSTTVIFVSKAIRGGRMEVAAGKLAVSKGQRADVKAFGARMVKDHSTANTKLMAVVRAKSIPYNVPTPMDNTMLNQSKGADFDRHYVQMMVKDHEEDVAMFQKASVSLPDANVRAFAAQTLPILKEHLAMIRSIAANLHLSPASK